VRLSLFIIQRRAVLKGASHLRVGRDPVSDQQVCSTARVKPVSSQIEAVYFIGQNLCVLRVRVCAATALCTAG
jgi:hypothetical protein